MSTSKRTSKYSGFASLAESIDIARHRDHLARSFEKAMRVTFAKLRPVHGLDAHFVRYQKWLADDGHLAEFSDGTAVYDVEFGADLQLKRIKQRQ
jgi:hypothetical protein